MGGTGCIYRNTLDRSEGVESEVLQFSRDCAGGFLEIAPELRQFSDLLDRAALGLRFDPGTAADAGEMLRRIRQAKGVSRWILFLELIRLLLQSPAPEVLASPLYAGTVGLESSEEMRKACQYILEHFDEEIDHDILARLTHKSPAYFSRLFKKTTRKTFTEFLTEVRLGHACRLLFETEMTIVDIAFGSGFRNLSNFNRRFKDAYGCSPRDYRKLRVTDR